MATMVESKGTWWLASKPARSEMRAGSTSSKIESEAMKNIISGTCGGIALVAGGHPFDTVKIKLQTQSTAGRIPMYSGAVDCVRKTVKVEGFSGLYRGITSPLVGQIFNQSCVFMTFHEIKAVMIAQNGGLQLTGTQSFLAGGMSGAVLALAESPTDLIKSKMQLQSTLNSASSVNYASTLNSVRHITQLTGVRGLYQGFAATLLRNSVGSALFFGTHNFVLKRFEVDGQQTASALFLSGATAGFVATAAAYPLDTIKSTLMADALLPRDRQYHGVLDCAKQLYERQGWRAFMRGLSPSLVRATPGCGLLMVTVEAVKQLL